MVHGTLTHLLLFSGETHGELSAGRVNCGVFDLACRTLGKYLYLPRTQNTVKPGELYRYLIMERSAPNLWTSNLTVVMSFYIEEKRNLFGGPWDQSVPSPDVKFLFSN